VRSIFTLTLPSPIKGEGKIFFEKAINIAEAA
jgi:hypothetical protein